MENVDMRETDEKVYIAWGSVRGWCGHRHRSFETALACVEEDRRRCSSGGGYSDRHVYAMTPAQLRDVLNAGGDQVKASRMRHYDWV